MFSDSKMASMRQFALWIVWIVSSSCDAKLEENIKVKDAPSVSELKQLVKKVHGLDLSKVEKQFSDLLRQIGHEAIIRDSDGIQVNLEDINGNQYGRRGRILNTPVVYVKNLLLQAAYIIMKVPFIADYQLRNGGNGQGGQISVFGGDIPDVPAK